MASLPAPVRGVLLDWDGTLVDSYQADARAYLEMFRKLGIDWTLKDLARHYSPNWYNVYRAARIPRAQWKRADFLWRRAYRYQDARPYPGAHRALAALARRYRVGLVTGGGRARVHRQLVEFDLERAFAVRVFSENTAHKKPHPAPLLLALRRLGLPCEESVYVGDAPQDIEMARNAGVFSIAVIGTSPVPARLKAARPDARIDSIKELPQFLRSLKR
ncbi:MAG: HAD family hydrolase [Candidatus Acidiferrales bacterium]